MVDFICFDAYSFDQSHMDPKTISKIMFKSNLIWVNLIVIKRIWFIHCDLIRIRIKIHNSSKWIETVSNLDQSFVSVKMER